MNKKYKKQARVVMAVALATTSIAHSAANLFAQSEESMNENTLTDVEEVKEENIEIEGLETEVEEVSEESLESEESIQYVERAVGDVAIDATNFPDAVFRGYISRNFDKNSDGILSSDEIANITSINLQGSTTIKSIQGIEHFPNLTSLHCGYDATWSSGIGTQHHGNLGITNIDVSKNANLTYLNCAYTSIASIDLSKNIELREFLGFRNTKLTSLDVSKNLKLEFLNLHTTGISSIDLSKNTELRSLYVVDTNMTNLDISKNTKLATLGIENSPNLNVIKSNSNSVVNLDGMNDTSFSLSIFYYMYTPNVKNLSGASINGNMLYRYTFGTPITYTYDCGTDRNGKVYLDVTLNLRGKSSITIDDSLDKVYDGQAIADPTSITKTGSNGAVTFEWYKADGTQLQAAPTEVGDYKVKAILADDNRYIGAEVEKEFTITKANSTIAINGNLDKVYDGQVVEPSVTTTGSTGAVTFEWYTENDTPLSTAPVNIGSYKVKAILADDANHIGAEIEETFSITKANSTIAINGNLDKVYDGQAVVEPSVTTTGSTGTVSFEWYMADSTKLAIVPVNVGSYKVKAILADDANHVGAEVEKEFTITKANSTIVINDDLNKAYDGQPVVEPSVTTTGSTGAVTFEWYTADGMKLQTAPVNIGSYKVKAILADDANHISTEVEKEFTITKATSTIIINDDLNKAYDGTAVLEPTDIVTTGSTGTVSIEWYAADGTLLTSAPVNAGSYKVKAILAEDTSYAGVEVEKEFIISQAASSVTITVELDKEYDGQPVVEPQVSVTGSTGTITYEWYKKEESATRATTWTKLATAPSKVGNYKVVVTVAGDGNYEAVTVEKEFSISGQETVVPTPGTGGSIINPDGTVGPEINPGDKVESNGPVITNPDGSITFPNGGTVTKPDGSVEVIQPEALLTPNKPEVVPTPGTGGSITNPDGTVGPEINPDDKVESNGSVITNPDGSITFPNGGTVTKPDGSVEVIKPGATLKPNGLMVEGTTTIPGEVTGVQTGDGTQAGLWTMLVGLSTGMMVFFRRKNRKEEV